MFWFPFSLLIDSFSLKSSPGLFASVDIFLRLKLFRF